MTCLHNEYSFELAKVALRSERLLAPARTRRRSSPQRGDLLPRALSLVLGHAVEGGTCSVKNRASRRIGENGTFRRSGCGAQRKSEVVKPVLAAPFRVSCAPHQFTHSQVPKSRVMPWPTRPRPPSQKTNEPVASVDSLPASST